MNIFNEGVAVSVINIVVNIALIIIFIYFFGQKSIGKYFDKGVITSTQEETPAAIPHPGKVEGVGCRDDGDIIFIFYL